MVANLLSFMNAGAYVTGEQLHKLQGFIMLSAIHDNFGLDFDVIFDYNTRDFPFVITAMGINELYNRRLILLQQKT